ncbi:MAG: DUF502 domain-containing protein [Coxiellaceae bacterium]|nr:DUF502 domain-containing protein [Coxiellaceae bacterium]
MDRTLSLLPDQYQPQNLFGFSIPGLGLIFTLIILFVTGLLVTNFLGHKLVRAWENMLSRIPLVRTIYSAVKQVVHALVQPSGQAFRKVLIVEYPRKGIWSIAFQTSDQFVGCPHPEDVITVFIPTTPNPTSGFLTIVPKADTQELEMSVEEGLKMVISLGVVMPDRLSKHLEDGDD